MTGEDVKTYDLIIIGAGPSGLHAACTAQTLGMSSLIIDRKGLAHSFYEYPQTLRFFSPPDEMEVGGVPLPMRGGEKPTREDILPYFRAVAEFKHLEMALWERVADFRREGDAYCVVTRTQPNDDIERTYRGRAVLLATGFWDRPNGLDCPGEHLPHVFNRFHEPTGFYRMPVLVVGGGNSAAFAAMSLAEAKAEVTLAMRRPPEAFQSGLRPFVLRDLNFFVEEGKIKLIPAARVSCVEPHQAWLEPFEYDKAKERCGMPVGKPYAVPARFVFSLTGQKSDTDFLKKIGLCVGEDGRPANDPETLETNLPNVFVSGSLADRKIDIIITSRQRVEETVNLIAARLQGKKDKDAG